MAVIKQISVYDGSAWNTDDVGVNDASNVDLQTIVNGQNNVQSALSSLVGTGVLASNKPVETGSDGKLTTAQTTSEKVVVTDTNGRLVDSDVTTTEINTLSGIGDGITVLKDVFKEDYFITHNNIYRGRILANSYDNNSNPGIFTNITGCGQAVDAGNFENIYVGDIIRVSYNSQPINFTVIGIDSYYYNTSTSKHHLCLFPDIAIPGTSTTTLKASQNTIEAGYAGTIGPTQVRTISDSLQTAFSWWRTPVQRYFTNTVSLQQASRNNASVLGRTTDGAWQNVFGGLLSISEIYGNTNFTSSTRDMYGKENQLPGFKLNPNLTRVLNSNRDGYINWWTDTYVESTTFTRILGSGRPEGGAFDSSVNYIVPMLFFGNPN